MTRQQDNTCDPVPVSPVNYRVKEFCDAYRIGKTKFYDEVKQGRLDYIKVGSRTLVPVSAAKSWQAARVAEVGR